MLRAKAVEVCTSCHPQAMRQAEQAFPHDPAKKGDCLACHAPHGGQTKALLVAKPVDLCTKCHEEFKR